MLSFKRIANLNEVYSQSANFSLGSKPSVSLNFKVEDKNYLVVGRNDRIWIYGGSDEKGVFSDDGL